MIFVLSFNSLISIILIFSTHSIFLLISIPDLPVENIHKIVFLYVNLINEKNASFPPYPACSRFCLFEKPRKRRVFLCPPGFTLSLLLHPYSQLSCVFSSVTVSPTGGQTTSSLACVIARSIRLFFCG